MKPILILLSVFLLTACESDFDKCMNARMPRALAEIDRLDRAAPMKVKQRLFAERKKFGIDYDEIRAEKLAREVCNDQGFYE